VKIGQDIGSQHRRTLPTNVTLARGAGGGGHPLAKAVPESPRLRGSGTGRQVPVIPGCGLARAYGPNCRRPLSARSGSEYQRGGKRDPRKNRAQYHASTHFSTAAHVSTESQESLRNARSPGVPRFCAGRCDSVWHCTNARSTARGVERIANSSGNQGVVLPSGAESGASSGDSAPTDPDLALIVNQWPTLPETVRQKVIGLVRTATNGTG
jgi:hypothetical protein